MRNDKGAATTFIPEGLDPQIKTREIVFDADVSGVTPFLKLATVSRQGGGHMSPPVPCSTAGPERVTAGGAAPAAAPGRKRSVPTYFLSIILSSCFIMPSSFFIIASPLDAHPLNVSPAAMTIVAAAAVHRPANVDMSPS